MAGGPSERPAIPRGSAATDVQPPPPRAAPSPLPARAPGRSTPRLTSSSRMCSAEHQGDDSGARPIGGLLCGHSGRHGRELRMSGALVSARPSLVSGLASSATSSRTTCRYVRPLAKVLRAPGVSHVLSPLPAGRNSTRFVAISGSAYLCRVTAPPRTVRADGAPVTSGPRLPRASLSPRGSIGAGDSAPRRAGHARHGTGPTRPSRRLCRPRPGHDYERGRAARRHRCGGAAGRVSAAGFHTSIRGSSPRESTSATPISSGGNLAVRIRSRSRRRRGVRFGDAGAPGCFRGLTMTSRPSRRCSRSAPRSRRAPPRPVVADDSIGSPKPMTTYVGLHDQNEGDRVGAAGSRTARHRDGGQLVDPGSPTSRGARCQTKGSRSANQRREHHRQAERPAVIVTPDASRHRSPLWRQEAGTGTRVIERGMPRGFSHHRDQPDTPGMRRRPRSDHGGESRERRGDPGARPRDQREGSRGARRPRGLGGVGGPR